MENHFGSQTKPEKLNDSFIIYVESTGMFLSASTRYRRVLSEKPCALPRILKFPFSVSKENKSNDRNSKIGNLVFIFLPKSVFLEATYIFLI